MIKDLLLITGFLGAGKTTFVNNAVSLFESKRIAVIVNEFGKQGIDGELIAQKGYEVKEISNGSIFCVCRMDMFIETLSQAAKTDADVIIVESSGLSDPTKINDVLMQTKKVTGDEFNYLGCICIADALNFEKVISTAVVVPEQIKQASLVLLNKTDLVDRDKTERVKNLIKQINPDCEIVSTSYSKIEPEVLKKLSSDKKQIIGGRVDIFSAQLTVDFTDTVAYSDLRELLDQLKPFIYRCKGYVETDQGCIFVDGVMDSISTEQVNHPKSKLVFLYKTSNNIKKIIRSFAEKSNIDIIFE